MDPIDAIDAQRRICDAVAEFAAANQDMPGATLVVSAELPEKPTQTLQERLEQEVRDLLDGAGRAWTPRLELKAGPGTKVVVDFDTVTNLLNAEPTLPFVRLVFPTNETSRASVGCKLQDDVVYSLVRAGDLYPVDDSQILLASPYLPGKPFLELRRRGQDIEVRAPNADWGIAVIAGDVKRPVGDQWLGGFSLATDAKVQGQLELTRRDERPLLIDLALDNGLSATRFYPVTRHGVLVTKNQVKLAGDGNGSSFLKTYECDTVEDAQQLERQFLAQQTLIHEVNTKVAVKQQSLKLPPAIGLEETNVWRGRPPVYEGTQVYEDDPRARRHDEPSSQGAGGAITELASTVQAEAPAAPQADHRVFVRTPFLSLSLWSEGKPQGLDRLAAIAAALDETHAMGAAHCDVKPANVRTIEGPREKGAAVARQWAILVDTESFAKPNGGIPYTGLRTPAFVHPDFDHGRPRETRIEILIGNDRVGFVALTLAAILGQEVVNQVFTYPAPLANKRREAIREAVKTRWSSSATDDLIAVLMEPLDAQSSTLVESTNSWSCITWLEKVKGAVLLASEGVPGPPSGSLTAADDFLESLRTEWRHTARPNKRELVSGEVNRLVGELFWRSYQRNLSGGGLALGALFAVALFIIMTGSK